MSMPIFVQWKWQERTKSFLVIFHFFDDYIKQNIRFRKKRFEGGDDRPAYLYFPEHHVSSLSINSKRRVQFKTVMTWSPSHLDLGLLSELLSYANIINGLKEAGKKELKEKLEGKDFEYLLNQAEEGHYVLLGYEFNKAKEKNWVFCNELCPEYIEYLKKLLNPYLRSY